MLIGPESDTASVCRVFIFKAPGYSPLRGQPACAKMAAYPDPHPLQSVTVTVEASAGPGLRLGLRLAMPGWAGRDSTPAPGPLWRSLTIPGPSNWTFGLWRVKVLVTLRSRQAAAAARTEWGKAGLAPDAGFTATVPEHCVTRLGRIYPSPSGSVTSHIRLQWM